VVQEVFLKVWTNRGKLQDVENFGAYLYCMTRNNAISGMRRMALETRIVSELSRNTLVSGKPADEALLQKQVLEKVKEAVDQLPKQQRLVYTLSREQGLLQEEIARQLNITLSTVQNHMTQALKNIRKHLYHYFPEALCFILLSNSAVAADYFF
jgi:RNA polymerase sigma factor (sigma-70 family)